jgi:hypothetical protein
MGKGLYALIESRKKEREEADKLMLFYKEIHFKEIAGRDDFMRRNAFIYDRECEVYPWEYIINLLAVEKAYYYANLMFECDIALLREYEEHFKCYNSMVRLMEKGRGESREEGELFRKYLDEAITEKYAEAHKLTDKMAGMLLREVLSDQVIEGRSVIEEYIDADMSWAGDGRATAWIEENGGKQFYLPEEGRYIPEKVKAVAFCRGYVINDEIGFDFSHQNEGSVVIHEGFLGKLLTFIIEQKRCRSKGINGIMEKIVTEGVLSKDQIYLEVGDREQRILYLLYKGINNVYLPGKADQGKLFKWYVAWGRYEKFYRLIRGYTEEEYAEGRYDNILEKYILFFYYANIAFPKNYRKREYIMYEGEGMFKCTYGKGSQVYWLRQQEDFKWIVEKREKRGDEVERCKVLDTMKMKVVEDLKKVPVVMETES